MYSEKLKKLAEYAQTKKIGNFSRYQPDLINQLKKETSFLLVTASNAERLWYIRNDIYIIKKCVICGKLSKFKNNNLDVCVSSKCTWQLINVDTGLTNAQVVGLKVSETLNTIQDSGLTRAKEIGLKSSKTLNKIQASGLTGAQEIGLKSKITKNKINPETGLTNAQEAGLKVSETLNTIQDSGLTRAKEIGLKGYITKNKINLTTGLTIAQSSGIKNSKTRLYNKYLEILSVFDKDYTLLTTSEEYLAQSTHLLEYKHKCGNVEKSYWPYVRCGKCYPYNRSIAENEILEYCQTLNDNVISNNRQVINPHEIDIYIPDSHLAIEYNGLYWHSADSIETENRDYHLNKMELCRNKDIQLLHIFENEWLDLVKQNIWKSIIRNKLGRSERIFARNCEIREVSFKDSKMFLNENHLQGTSISKIRYGLYKDGELVSLMTFGKPRFNKKVDWELLRYCNLVNCAVVGGASRLFKHFLRNYTGSVVSYADLRRSDGGLYLALGFELSHESEPNYWYYYNTNNLQLESRVKYQKHKLSKLLEVFDPVLTESENMYANGYRKIFDCGNQVWNYK